MRKIPKPSPAASTLLSLREFDTHIRLEPGETGLGEISEGRGENLSTVRKESLAPSRSRLRVRSAPDLARLPDASYWRWGFYPKTLKRVDAREKPPSTQGSEP